MVKVTTLREAARRINKGDIAAQIERGDVVAIERGGRIVLYLLPWSWLERVQAYTQRANAFYHRPSPERDLLPTYGLTADLRIDLALNGGYAVVTFGSKPSAIFVAADRHWQRVVEEEGQ